jgi:hypothetical protein
MVSSVTTPVGFLLGTKKTSRYPLSKRESGPHSQYGRCGEGKIILPLLGNKEVSKYELENRWQKVEMFKFGVPSQHVTGGTDTVHDI